MAALLEFVSGIVDGLGLLALAVSIGGLVYALAVCRGWVAGSEVERRATADSLLAVVLGAGLVALLRLIQLVLKPWALADSTGAWAIEPFLHTQVFRAGLSAVLLAIGLAGAALWLRRAPERRSRWAAALLAGGLYMANEAWLSHATSRIEGSGLLMAVTTVHMLGAVVWAGGIAHLLLFRWRWRGRREVREVWPELVRRFSPLGIACVALIVGPGVYLAWRYVADWSGLIGTGYGNMLAVKIGLFAFVFILATLNFSAARAWRTAGAPRRMAERVPAYVEVELILGAALLFTASALTSFPPAVDTTEHVATPAEIWAMFAPKPPRLNGPEIVMIDAPELTDLATGAIGRKPDSRWDRFNHNVSGVIVLAIAGLALLDRTGRVAWARHWPLAFVAFSVLIVLFANPDEWPLGPLGLAESAQNTEVVQHWLAAIVVLGLGVFEWRVRRGPLVPTSLPFVFPVLCIAGGIVLLTHSHEIVELKREFLVQSTHVAMGFLGVVVGCARWLELRLSPPQNQVAGYVAVAGMTLVGLILLFYVTPS